MFESNVFFSMSNQNLNNYYVAEHFHECYELVYYIRGSGVSIIDNKTYVYKEHTFCIIPPNTIHWEHTDSETDLMYIGFYYDDSIGKLPALLTSDSETLPIYNAMCGVMKEMSNQEANYNMMLTLYLNVMIIEALRITKIKPDNTNKIDIQIEYAINYINDNFAKNFKLQELAGTLGYSYDYFRHLFREEYGISLKQYIIELRIKYAKNLLQQTSKPIAQVAQECGFASTARFISMFKQHVGKPPLSYRKEFSKYIERANYIEQ